MTNMNPVNLNEFKLRYSRKSDGKEFFGKSITKFSFCLIDPEKTEERIYLSHYELRTRFLSHQGNKFTMSVMGKARKGKRIIRNKEAFEKYLNQRTEAIS